MKKIISLGMPIANKKHWCLFIFTALFAFLSHTAYAQNDDCAGAITLTINPDLACGTVTAGTTVGATQSMAAAPCFGNPDDDVWFKFVATKTSHHVTLSNIVAVSGTSTDMYFQVLSGACGSTASILCSDAESSTVAGLTVGDTYYVRVYSNATSSRQNFDICIGTHPQAPANDECAGAVALTVNTDLNCGAVTNGTTVGATQSMAAAPCSGNPDDDVWYKFVATQATHVITLSGVGTVLGTSTDMYFQVLSGACGSTTSVLCSDPNTNTVTGLTIGETYYIRVYSNAATSRQVFDICVGSFPPPPANDDCTGAVTLTVNPDLNCGTTTAGTTMGATQSMAAAPCAGTPDDDVWFKFVATHATHVITLSNVVAGYGTSTDMYFQVLSGACGTTTSVLCSDPNLNTVSGLTVGNTYYIRVYSNAATSRQNFNICVGTMPPPPANDDCAGATLLTVNPDLNCGTITAGTTAGATQSMAAAPCFGTPDDDVWFKFVATQTSHVVKLSGVTAVLDTSIAKNFQVFSGACGSTTSILCSSADLSTLTGLTVGDTYYIRVYSNTATSRLNFNICIGTFPPPPANDDCAGAVMLSVNPTLTCDTVIAGTIVSATQSMAAAPCNGNPDGDVWYKFVATGESHQITLSDIVIVQGFSTDMYFQVLSGTCGATTSVLCSDPNTNTVSGLTVGDTYFIRVYSVSNLSKQNFNICVASFPQAPANDLCADARVLTPGTDFDAVKVTATNVGATRTASDPTPVCGASNFETNGKDVWFTVTASSVNLTLETRGNSDTGFTDTGLAVYSGTCGTLTALGCNDNEGNGNFSKIDLTGLTDGQVLLVRVWGNNGSFGSFDIAAYDSCNISPPLGNDEQALEQGQTLADLDLFGDNLTWYSDAALTTVVPNTTVAVDGTTYYVTQRVDSCTSGALAIEVSIADPCAGTMAPAGNDEQALNQGQTLADLTVTGDNLTWYSDAALTTMIPNTTVAVDATTYYVTQTVGACTSGALAIEVTVTDPCAGVMAPAGDDEQALNQGQTLADLTVTGDNLTWYSDAALTTVIPNTTVAVDGTTYYVTQTMGACTSDALAIEVTVIDPCAGIMAPAGNAMQDFNTGETLAGLEVTGENLTWYADEALTTLLPENTVLIDGTTYYVTQTVGACTSEALAVTVNEVLGTKGFDSASFSYHPNPVTDVLNLSYGKDITEVTVYNMLGQAVLVKTINASETTIDLSNLAAATYIVKVKAGDVSKAIRIVKK